MAREETRGLVTDQVLELLAYAHGIETSYTDWRGRPAQVSNDSLVAVLAALGVDAATHAGASEALERIRAENRDRLLPPVTICGAGKDGFAAEIQDRGVTILGDEVRVSAFAGEAEANVTLQSGEIIPLGPGEPAIASLVPEELGIGRYPGVTRYRLPADVPVGWHRVTASRDGRTESAALLVTRIPELPAGRSWGFWTQLYSVRSSGSWGLGDLRDLGDLAAWSGRDLGAGFVVVNPMHAAEPAPPISPSPYLPMSRRFASPLYLRVEDVLEFAALEADERALVVRLAREMSVRSRTLDPLDRDAVWTAKSRALEALRKVPLSDARRKEYDRYREREGDALLGFATWCALAEEHGPDWRRWPSGLHDPGSAQVAAERGRLADRIDMHMWLQWQLDRQLESAQRRATDAGMPIGVVHDLAVGVAPGGADAWVYQGIFAHGMSVGAPPDEFNQRGQDWGQPPWHPGRLADAAYLPYREMLRGILRHAGGLRLDHALQVSRLWWVPEGGSPADGAYVRYDSKALLSALNFEADQAGAVVIGEDLGTVDPWVRDDLAGHHVLGTSLLWFERDEKGRPKPSRDWRARSLATVGTHDLPPITGFLHGDHVALRERLGLLTRSPAEELADHERQLDEWLSLLRKEGLLGNEPTDEEIVQALHGFLARTPALLIGISLADAVGERRTQNQPGTSDEYPNWRVPLADAESRPVLLDALPEDPRVTEALRPVREALSRTAG